MFKFKKCRVLKYNGYFNNEPLRDTIFVKNNFSQPLLTSKYYLFLYVPYYKPETHLNTEASTVISNLWIKQLKTTKVEIKKVDS